MMKLDKMSITTLLYNKHTLFITTKNLDYIRNAQEIKLISDHAQSCTVIGSESKSYPLRLLTVYLKLIFMSAAKFDVIFVGFAPQLVLPLFYLKFRKKYIIEDFFISMYDTLCCDRQKVKPESILGRFLHATDKLALSYADLIICDTNAHGQYFSREFQVPESRLYTLYLEADSQIYTNASSSRPNHLNNKFIVLYFGSVLPLQGIDVVLQTMTLLKDDPDIFFYFIGPIKDPELLKNKPESSNIVYIDWLPQKELTQYISQADLCLAGHFHASIEKAKRTIPGKAYIYKAMKKPMILGDNPANHELFTNDPDAIFVEMGNPQKLAQTIKQLSNPEPPL